MNFKKKKSNEYELEEPAQKLICAKCKAVNSISLAPIKGEKNKYLMVCEVCGFVATPGSKIRLSVEEGKVVAEVGYDGPEEGQA